MIVLDTARADAFGRWGGAAGTTPVMDDLARAGQAPARAIAPSAWTLPSHVGMLAGHDARDFGLAQAPHGRLPAVRGPMRDNAASLLPVVLRRAGYDTRGASANIWLSAHTGFDTGFGHFTSLRYQRPAPHAGAGALRRMRWLASCVHPTASDGAVHGREVLGEWMDDVDASRPFFWFMNLVECHSPYMPPHPFNSLSIPQRLRAAVDTARYQTFDGFLRINVTDETIPDDAMARMRHLYLDSIRWLDHWLEWLVGELDRRGLADDTILVVTSDHGEHFGEHGLWGHGHALDDELLHVPLVARGPDLGDWPDLCSLTWLPHLLTAAVGVEGHESWAEPSAVAVSSHDRLSSPADRNFLDLAARMPLTPAGRSLVTTSLTSATDGTHSLIVSGGERGPDDVEFRYTGPDHAPDVEAARARLREAVAPALASLARHPDVNATPDADTTIDADIAEQMRVLGYAD